MNRRLRGCLPLTAKSLEPSVPGGAKSQLKNRQKKQKDHYKHTKNLPPLEPDDNVRYQTSTSWEPAIIVQRHSAPHSYDLITTRGNIIQWHLKQTRETRPEVIVPVIDDTPLSTNQSPRQRSNANTNPQPTERRTSSGRL